MYHPFSNPRDTHCFIRYKGHIHFHDYLNISPFSRQLHSGLLRVMYPAISTLTVGLMLAVGSNSSREIAAQLTIVPTCSKPAVSL